MGKLKKLKNRIKQFVTSDTITDEEYQEYLEMYHNIKNNKSDNYNQNDTDELVIEEEQAQYVNLSGLSNVDVCDYIHEQCEIMKEALEHIEVVKEEYDITTEQFSDIELFENAPESIKTKIQESAEIVDNYTVDRKINNFGEKKLTATVYKMMETLEDDIPNDIKIIQENETYVEVVRRDIRILEGERMVLKMEVNKLINKQKNIRRMSIAIFICLLLVYSMFVIIVYSIEDEVNMLMFIAVTVLGAILASCIFAYVNLIRRRVEVCGIKINKVTVLLNKVKIKYVNTASLLEYEYNKYKIKNSYDLGRKFQLYKDMKQNQKKAFQMTGMLNKAENDLIYKLNRLGMKDSSVWVRQVKALYKPKEMVEIRHELSVRRQQLREQIEYNENKIDIAEKNIKETIKKYPEYKDSTMQILDEFERKMAKNY